MAIDLMFLFFSHDFYFMFCHFLCFLNLHLFYDAFVSSDSGQSSKGFTRETRLRSRRTPV